MSDITRGYSCLFRTHGCHGCHGCQIAPGTPGNPPKWWPSDHHPAAFHWRWPRRPRSLAVPRWGSQGRRLLLLAWEILIMVEAFSGNHLFLSIFLGGWNKWRGSHVYKHKGTPSSDFTNPHCCGFCCSNSENNIPPFWNDWTIVNGGSSCSCWLNQSVCLNSRLRAGWKSILNTVSVSVKEITFNSKIQWNTVLPSRISRTIFWD